MILKNIIKNKRTFVIAEIGVNHNGSFKNAIKYIKLAKNCGADAVKFQNFKASSLVTYKAPKAEYQIKNTKNNSTQFQMLKKLELINNDYLKLIKECKKRKIQFLSSPFDNESLLFLQNNLKLKTIKIPSGEINNYNLLSLVKKTCLIISTGMSNIGEIIESINFIFKKKIFKLKKKDKVEIINKKLHKYIKYKVVILHCVTDYPVADKFANLLAIKTLKEKLNLEVGYSDHTKGTLAPSIAVSFGAKIIEKHLTINKNENGPDHKASLNPKEFKEMVNLIRQVEILRGDGIKKKEVCEIKNTKIARKSIVAKKDISKFERFTLNNITTKRPGTGVSASLFFKYIGKIASKKYKKDEFIK
jgi:N-acetylneuraminate synthase